MHVQFQRLESEWAHSSWKEVFWFDFNHSCATFFTSYRVVNAWLPSPLSAIRRRENPWGWNLVSRGAKDSQSLYPGLCQQLNMQCGVGNFHEEANYLRRSNVYVAYCWLESELDSWADFRMWNWSFLLLCPQFSTINLFNPKRGAVLA